MPHIPVQQVILATLNPEHPRLLVDADGFKTIATLVKTHTVARRWYGIIKGHAAMILTEPVSAYEIPDGKRLLSTSRRVVERLYYLALVYRLEGDARYLERAWAELQAAAAFPDWNPSHFLDTAEMTHAFAIGYDWLYHDLTPARRAVIRDAIVSHGLTPALSCYRKANWWSTSTHNWNQVCNGGIGAGALAIGDELPELAAEILWNAVSSLPLAMRSFAPDGAWAEGPGYWGYATQYNVMILAALDTALGTDFGLSDIPGFNACGDFPLYMHGATGFSFNFADAGAARLTAPQLQWLATRFNRPDYAACQFRRDQPHPLDLIWFDPRGAEPVSTDVPLDRCFRGVQVASMRSAWGDANAAFVGIKAGRNGVNHDNLDLGSFIYEVDGVRWACDLGSDNYNLPAYFGKARYTYYRLRAEGHNTILINPGAGPDQNPRGQATFTQFVAGTDTADATVDLADAYPGAVESAARHYRLRDGRRVLTVTDAVVARAPVEFWWFMHTQAEIVIHDNGRSATLTRAGKAITVRISGGPAAARFELMEARPLPTSPDPDGQNPNNGAAMLNPAGGTRSHSRVGTTPAWGQPDAAKAYRKLAIHLSGVTRLDLSVSLAPD